MKKNNWNIHFHDNILMLLQTTLINKKWTQYSWPNIIIHKTWECLFLNWGNYIWLEYFTSKLSSRIWNLTPFIELILDFTFVTHEFPSFTLDQEKVYICIYKNWHRRKTLLASNQKRLVIEFRGKWQETCFINKQHAVFNDTFSEETSHIEVTHDNNSLCNGKKLYELKKDIRHTWKTLLMNL